MVHFLKLLILFFTLTANAAYFTQSDILINGSFPSSSNPLGIRLSDGTSFITTLPISQAVKTANTFATGTFTASDAVVAAPIGDGSLISGASTVGSIVSIVIPAGYQSWNVLLKGYVSGAIYTEASVNSTNGTDGDWIDIKGRKTGTAPGIETTVFAETSNGYYRGNPASFTYFRCRLIGATGPSVTISLADSTGAVFLNSGIPTGNSVIGKVGIDQTTPGVTNAISVTNFPSTQAISAASLPLPTGASTETTIAALNNKVTAVNTGAVTISTALPVGTNSIGSVTANAGTNLNTSALALDSTVAKDASINLLLKPASTLAAVTAITNTVTVKADTLVNQTNAFRITTRGSFLRINAAATNVLRTGSGTLKRICLNTGANGSSITLYDNTAASGTIIAVISAIASTAFNCSDYDLILNNGLTAVTVGNADWTAVWE